MGKSPISKVLEVKSNLNVFDENLSGIDVLSNLKLLLSNVLKLSSNLGILEPEATEVCSSNLFIPLSNEIVVSLKSLL